MRIRRFPVFVPLLGIGPILLACFMCIKSFSVAQNLGQNFVRNPVKNSARSPEPHPEMSRDAFESETCSACHPLEFQQWEQSDHAFAMDHANASTVMGDFRDRIYIHVGFDDLLRLKDGEIRILLQNLSEEEHGAKLYDDGPEITKTDFIIALSGTNESAPKAGVREKIFDNLDPERKIQWNKAMQFREKVGFTRPGEVSIAHQKITDRLRELEKQGKIDLAFGTKFHIFQKDSRYYIATTNRKGQFESFRIKYVLGIRPLQQYLIEFPDGRIQCLPLAWDTLKKRWFHLYPKERILPNDPLHWTRPLQNWNHMCAECHATDLRKNFDLKTNTYDTKWSEIRIGCRACHFSDDSPEKPTSNRCKIPSKYAFPSQDLDACSACHSRRRTLSAEPFSGKEHFLDRFIPETPDLEHYYPDGQILEENFEYGSFLQSRMYHYGVRCTECHNPHSLELVREENRMCSRCHSPEIYDTPRHHFHFKKESHPASGSGKRSSTKNTPKLQSQKPVQKGNQDGTRCIDCHLVESTYMIVDKRRDHAMKRPRPDLTIELGVPNACNLCHFDEEKGEDAHWAQSWIQKWYEKKRGSVVGFTSETGESPHFAHAIAKGRKNDPGAIPDLLAVARNSNPRDIRPITRAAATAQLGRFSPEELRQYVKSNLQTPERNGNPSSGNNAESPRDVLDEFLRDPEGIVRLAAVSAMESRSPQEQVQNLLPLLRDPLRSVRIESARILSPVPKSLFSREDYDSWRKGAQEYVESLLLAQDTAAAHLNIAIFRDNLLREQMRTQPQISLEHFRTATDPIVKTYETAIVLDPLFIPARVNLAMLQNDRMEPEKAEKQFRTVMQIDPEMGEVHYSFALLLAEQDRVRESLAHFQKALESIPENPRLRYNFGLALLKLGKTEEAKRQLTESLRLDPNNRDAKAALSLISEEKN